MQEASSKVRWQSVADLLHSILHGKLLIFGNMRISTYVNQLQSRLNRGLTSVATIMGLEHKQSV